MNRVVKRVPHRLDRIAPSIDVAVFLITFNAHCRARVLHRTGVHASFCDYCRAAEENGIGVGRYVIMPDHVHLFVAPGRQAATSLGRWVAGLKRAMGGALARDGVQKSQIPGQRLRGFWQPGFHDHLLRSEESYAQKWEYVRMNPVRAGLVVEPDVWPYQGEIDVIDRV